VIVGRGGRAWSWVRFVILGQFVSIVVRCVVVVVVVVCLFFFSSAVSRLPSPAACACTSCRSAWCCKGFICGRVVGHGAAGRSSTSVSRGFLRYVVSWSSDAVVARGHCAPHISVGQILGMPSPTVCVEITLVPPVIGPQAAWQRHDLAPQT
jgi:hypothetical protein